MTDEDRRLWEKRYRNEERTGKVTPSALLPAYVLVTTSGRALDLACGRGRNALWLAAHGYHTLAVDISRAALEHAQQLAQHQQLTTHCQFAQVDLDTFRPPQGQLDVVCMCRFLDRALLPTIQAALRPGGLLIIETFNWRRAEAHPDANPEYLLEPDELRGVITGLTILHHSENHDTTSLVAQRPHQEANRRQLGDR
jgi:tellurite methyltransferase